MTVFSLPPEMCEEYYGRDPNNGNKVGSHKKLTKSVKNWLKRRKIEYEFEFVETRTLLAEGTPFQMHNRTIMIGQRWDIKREYLLKIPDELWALQFKLTWL
jgi:hypothetical protein